MSEEAATSPVVGVENGADEACGDNTDFVPKVELSEVEATSGEEEEVVCFKQRARLFVFVAEDTYGGEVRTNYWKERGTGDIKLLRHKELGKVRVLMRQEKTLKVCANHLISPHVQLTPNVGSDRSWVFTAADYAEEELETKTFAIKFGTAEKADFFKEKVELAKLINDGKKPADELSELVEDDEEEQPKRAAEKAPEAPDAADKLAEGISKVGLTGPRALCGGFSSAEVDNEDVKAVSEFAVKELAKGPLVKVVEAAKQVVAGMNYRISIHVKHEDDTVHSYVVTVFKPLPHTGEPMKLSGSEHHGQI